MADRLKDDPRSLAEIWRGADAAARRRLLRRHDEAALLAALSAAGSLRPAQRPPAGDWSIWAILAGRGFGKTHAGAEWVHALAETRPRRFALVATSLDVARAVMVEGESGLLARVPPGGDVTFTPSLKQLDWANGSQARLFSGGEPDALRGGQFDFAWGDEFAHWPRAEATLTNLRLATRLGAHPRLLLTTTPLPFAWLKDLLGEPGVVVTRGAMRDNAANLSATFIDTLQRRYGGSATGRQELEGEIVDDIAGALWTRALIERQRRSVVPALVRIIIGVDPPAGGANGVCGIVAVGLGADGLGHVLADASVAGVRPEGWARAVVAAAERWGADKVVAEVNNGGDMVTAVLKAIDTALPVQAVRAARGKVARAEPVASLYGEGRVVHVGAFPALEDQLCGLLASGVYAGPGASPDRADALVWALTALMLGDRPARPGVRGL
ncbi:DNA-packaging protein [Polymorphobacter fuscus]|uniref:ATP-binding protein n=1 Tax=Sandarakinorhabdus fusca TaxID=1439888 RepID=A0A7C9GPH1_9SPHN|nr:terminase family protein [Polymorphobacter fuscus]KAB7648173.1 DNA-packaging protein [Polymorphobacter fuscus]MQT15671.1 ATP-binding protein [Polymorphobacter fuscus]NJC08058.1 phage terminase large subunit-like protein [Polymorphobacter fuscus]